MRFGLDEQQTMIADNVRRMVEDIFSREVIDQFARDSIVLEEWRAALGESGLLGICADEDAGGIGLGVVDALAVVHAAGSRTVPFPIGDSIAAAKLLGARPELVENIVAGKMIIAFASLAPGRADSDASGLILSSELPGTFWGSEADALLVDADMPDGKAGWLLIKSDDPGVRISPRTSIDPTTPAANVILEQARGEYLGPVEPSFRRFRTILAAAEMEGAARTCADLAVGYMKERRQFDQEIGKFQALKHIAATDALHMENMSLANAYAAWAHDAESADADMAAHIAKQYASESARLVAEDSIQCHGGIGFTWEYGLHFLLRRILRLGASFGTAAEHREALIAQLIAAHDADGSE